MKKKTKNIIINSISTISISSVLISPIFLSKLKKETQNISKTQFRNIEDYKSEFNLDKDSSFKINTSNKINIENSNTFKSIDGGFVVLDSKQNVLCLNDEDPSKIQWQFKIEDSKNILDIEYSYSYDALLVLYIDNQENLKLKYLTQQKDYFGEIENSEIQEYEIVKKGLEILDMRLWSLSPIYESNKPVSNYYVWYRGNVKANERLSSKILELQKDSIWIEEMDGQFYNEDSFLKQYAVWNNQTQTSKKFVILGLHAFLEQTYILFLNEDGNFYVAWFSNNSLRTIRAINVPNSNYNLYSLQEQQRNDLLFSLNTNIKMTHDMNFSYLLNLNNIDKSKNQNPLLIHWDSLLMTSSRHLVSNFDGKLNIYNGYVDDSIIASKGYSSSSNNSPYIGMAYSKKNSNNDENYFLFIIKNLSSATTYDDLIDNNDYFSNDKVRKYLFKEVEIQSNNKYFADFGSNKLKDTNNKIMNLSSTSELNSLIPQMGIPIVKWSVNDENSKNFPYQSNLLFTKSNSDRAIIIDLKNRESNTSNEAVYCYFTRFKNNKSLIDLKITNKDNKNVIEATDHNYLSSFLNISNLSSNEQVWELLTNVNETSEFYIDPESIYYSAINKKAKYVYLDLYSTITYDSKGINKKTLQDLKNNLSSEFKIGTIRIEGFNEVDATEIKNPYIIPNVEINGKYPSTFIPSLIEISDSNIKSILWNFIFSKGDDVLLEENRWIVNLKNDENFTSKNVHLFDDFFKKIEIKERNNIEGSILLNVLINSKYTIPSGNKDLKVNNIKISGFRNIPNTTINGNSKDDILIFKNSSNYNVPYLDGDTWQEPSFKQENTNFLKFEDFKKWVWENIFNSSYNNWSPINSSNPSNNFVNNLALNLTLSKQHGLNKLNTNDYLSSNNLVFSNFNFYPSLGYFSVDIGLNVWYENGELVWTKDYSIENKAGTKELSDIVKNTFWIGGFRIDNVETQYDDSKIWQLDGVDNFLITELLQSQNSNNKKTFEEQLRNCVIKNKLIKLPYWVDQNVLLNEEIVFELYDYQISNGSGSIRIRLKNNNWRIDDQGKVKNDNTFSNIQVSGFLKAKGVEIDDSFVYDIKSDKTIFVDLSNNKNNLQLEDFFSNIEKKYIEKIVLNDKEKLRTEQQWKESLEFYYAVSEKEISEINFNEFSHKKNQIIDALNSKINSSLGKINYLNSEGSNSGLKIYIYVKDIKSNEFLNSIFSNSQDQAKGKNLVSLVNTSNISLKLDLQSYFLNLQQEKIINVKSYNAQTSYIDSLVFPTFDQEMVGKNISFENIQNILIDLGYTFEYSWLDMYGNKQTLLNKIPSKFYLRSNMSTIDLKIYFSKNNIPSIYIFNDSSYQTNEQKLTLSLNLKKSININYTAFKDMYTNSIFSSNNSLKIYDSSNVLKNNIDLIIKKWKDVEQEFFSNLANGDVGLTETYKEILDLKYSLNGSEFIYTIDEIWKLIEQDWKLAILGDKEKFDKIRFYSPNFANGTKISIKISIKENYQNQYDIFYVLGQENEIVNHGLSTTFNMKNLIEQWKSNEVFLQLDSNFKLSLSMSDFNGIKWEELKLILRNNLGIVFEYSLDNGKTWVENLQELNVQNNNNIQQLYLRAYVLQDTREDWKNNLEVTINNLTSNSNDLTNKYSGIEIFELVVPETISIDQKIIENFSNKANSLFSGNTKKININIQELEKSIDLLKQELITFNKNKNNKFNLTKDDFEIEFKFCLSNDLEENVGAGTKFIKYGTNFQDEVNKALENLEDRSFNGVSFRIRLKNYEQNSNYTNIDFTSDKKWILVVSEHILLKDSSNNDFNNPIKIYLDTIVEKMLKINFVLSNDNEIFFDFSNQFYHEESTNTIYSDETKRLKVQFLIDKNIPENYESYINDKLVWIDTIPKKLESNKDIFVRVVVNNENYVYGPAIEQTARIYKLHPNTKNPYIFIDMQQLSNLELSGTINIGNNTSNVFDQNVLIEKEKQLINNFLASNANVKYNSEDFYIAYKLIYENENENLLSWLSLNELLNQIEQLSKKYDSDNFGIVSFISGQFKIKATIKSKINNLVIIDKSTSSLDKVKSGELIKTNNLITRIDLTNLVNHLSNNKVSVINKKQNQRSYVDLVAAKKELFIENVYGTSTSSFLLNKSFNDIFQFFKYKLGINFSFSAGINDKWYNNLEQVTIFDDVSCAIYIKIFNSTFSQIQLFDSTNQNQENIEPNLFRKINSLIDWPRTIKVDINFLETLKLEGTTKNITNIEILKVREKQIIDEVLFNSLPANYDDKIYNEIYNCNLKIVYSIGGQSIEVDGKTATWFTLDDLQNIFANKKINFSTNEVWVKFQIFNEGNKYQLSNNNYIIVNKENLDNAAKFKIFIHTRQDLEQKWIYENLLLEGSVSKYQIVGLERWLINIPNGLIVEFNSRTNKDTLLPLDQYWSEKYNQYSIDSYKNYWIRFKIKPGFVFENNLNSIYSEPIKLNTSNFSISLNAQSSWLNLIKLSGNTKNLNINEDKAIENFYNANQISNKDVVKIVYSIDEINWYKKEEFIILLDNLSGSLNEQKWIIQREDIKAKWVLNQTYSEDNKYSLLVDDILVDNDEDNPFVQLITKDKNQDVKGYINIDNLTPFVANNFEVWNTNKNAILLTKNISKFNSMLSGYSSSGIFDIVYKNDSNDNLKANNKIFNSNTGEILQYTELVGNFTNKYIEISFVSNSLDYQVYKNNVLQKDNSYTLSSPEIKFYISIEIENPLKNKEIIVSFKDDKEQPIFYQAEGGFNIFIKDNQTNIKQNFKEFLNILPTDQANALELAYYVSDKELDEKQLKEITSFDHLYKENEQNEQKYGLWRTFDDNIKNLGLLVNDYVIVSLRIKKEYLPNQNNKGFVLLDSENNYVQKRVYGYKVRVSEIEVDWTSLKLKNVGKLEHQSEFLDGYAMMETISLVEDAKRNYQGVSLKLNYFNEFYENNENNILIAGDGSKLVKRESQNSTIKGYFKNEDQQLIVDPNTNQNIPIYVSSDGLLAAPIKSNQVTRSKELIEIENNLFKLDLSENDKINKFNLFKKQFIQIEFMNKQGNAPKGEFDYYIDNGNKTRDYILKDEIKLAVENDNQITYQFNNNEFLKTIDDHKNIKQNYLNSEDPTKEPISGNSQLTLQFKLKRTSNNENEIELSDLNSIQSQLQKDFLGKVKLQATYTPLNGMSYIVEDANIYKLKNLKNGDQFKIEIISTDDKNYIFVQESLPLIFTISGLYEKPIEKSLLANLRVQQEGTINGNGKFNILVDNPLDSSDDNKKLEDVLGNYKFVIRVWNSEKMIKHDWTDELESINDLKNGDKIEWKLIANDGSPLVDQYYNTIADRSKHQVENNSFSFILINRKGINNIDQKQPIYQIGQIPDQANAYPEESGYLIDGLQELNKDEFETITFEEFDRLMSIMEFDYIGFNGSGNMVSVQNIKTVNVNMVQVNTLSPRRVVQLDYLINKGYIKFYANSTPFNWNQVKDENGNWLASPGNLKNGDRIKVEYKDPFMSSPYIWNAPNVSGLVQINDKLSSIVWWTLGFASGGTLLIFLFIYFLAKNRKLKKK